MPPSFLFYDLETFGQDPRRTRIAQFATVRTDTQLNVIEEPISFLVKPADDLLPSPYATLITGITRNTHNVKASAKSQPSAHITMQMTQPHTCSSATTRYVSTTNSSATGYSVTSTTHTNASGATAIHGGTCWTCCDSCTHYAQKASTGQHVKTVPPHSKLEHSSPCQPCTRRHSTRSIIRCLCHHQHGA